MFANALSPGSDRLRRPRLRSSRNINGLCRPRSRCDGAPSTGALGQCPTADRAPCRSLPRQPFGIPPPRHNKWGQSLFFARRVLPISNGGSRPSPPDRVRTLTPQPPDYGKDCIRLQAMKFIGAAKTRVRETGPCGTRVTIALEAEADATRTNNASSGRRMHRPIGRRRLDDVRRARGIGTNVAVCCDARRGACLRS